VGCDGRRYGQVSSGPASSRPRGPGSRASDAALYGEPIPTAALLSFRLGGSDGVSVEAAKWRHALATLGFTTTTVAGSGPVDHVLPGLSIGADEPPLGSELVSALEDADLVVVENLCSLPLNPRAAALVGEVLAGRPAVLHHHDLAWQRPGFDGHPPPPTDARWSHVTINELSRRQLAERGVRATTVYNSFDTGRPEPDRCSPAGPDGRRRRAVRSSLGIGAHALLVLQPTRAIPRKNIAGGLGVATELGATFWLLGPAEDGFGPELDALVDQARCPVVLGPAPDQVGTGAEDAYLACDVVTLPSTWEGFGNPTIESVVHRRPLAIGPYPVASELAAFGFDWFGLSETDRLRHWLEAPDPALLEHNLAVASAHFSLEDLPDRIAAVLPPW
jgi:glycosyltransferase involved in cell wall biosynthesis